MINDDENLENSISIKENNLSSENEDKQISKMSDSSKPSNENNISEQKTLYSSVIGSTLFSSIQNESYEKENNSPKKPSPNIIFTKKYILSSFGNQTATKTLQDIILNEASEKDIDLIVNELSGSFSSIIKDKYGNYFCTDLFQVCEKSHKIKILKELSENICDISVDKCGNHPLQKLISYTSSEEEYNLIIHSFIKDTNKLLTASLDKYGSYVIQKIIEHIPEKYRNLFNLIYIKHLCLISKQKFGVVGAKLFLSNTKNEKNINQIINVIRNDFLNLAKNEYGIYLLNHIIEKMHNTNLASEIKKEIMDNFADLFYNKNCFNQICYPFWNYTGHHF